MGESLFDLTNFTAAYSSEPAALMNVCHELENPPFGEAKAN
jgi:hypothetical protein